MLDNIISIYGIKTGYVGMKIFLFYFEMAIKITGSAQNYRVGRVSGNTPIFLGLIRQKLKLMNHIYRYICFFSFKAYGDDSKLFIEKVKGNPQ